MQVIQHYAQLYFTVCMYYILPSEDGYLEVVGFEAIANEAIHPATKIHLLHHVISLYVIINMAILRAQAQAL